MSVLAIIGVGTASFTAFPLYDSSIHCKALNESTIEAVAKANGGGCLTREQSMKSNAQNLWPELSERNRNDCTTLASFGGGSYTVLMLCSLKAHTSSLTQATSLSQSPSSNFAIEKAPECSDGREMCPPWERDWKDLEPLKPNDFVTFSGDVYRMPF